MGRRLVAENMEEDTDIRVCGKGQIPQDGTFYRVVAVKRGCVRKPKFEDFNVTFKIISKKGM